MDEAGRSTSDTLCRTRRASRAAAPWTRSASPAHAAGHPDRSEPVPAAAGYSAGSPAAIVSLPASESGLMVRPVSPKTIVTRGESQQKKANGR